MQTHLATRDRVRIFTLLMQLSTAFKNKGYVHELYEG